MPPKKSKPPAGTYADKETGETIKVSRAPVYGAWKRFRPTENPGYTWFPFDVINWLTSPVVNAMTPADRGIYLWLLCVQWRDGYLATDILSLSMQTGHDRRTLARWFSLWGDRLYVCVDHPNGGEDCTGISPLRIAPDAARRHRRTSDAIRQHPLASEPIGAYPLPSDTLRCCPMIVNGKLHFLAIKQGKINLAAVEERRGDGELEGEREQIDSKQAMHVLTNVLTSTKDNSKSNGKSKNPSPPSPILFDLSKSGCTVCKQYCMSCTCEFTCPECDQALTGIDALANHLFKDHDRMWLRLEAGEWMSYLMDDIENEDDLA